MVTPNKRLFQADCTVFVDVDALVFVRFGFENGQHATALLKFANGSSETIDGNAASKLHDQLSDIQSRDEKNVPLRVPAKDTAPENKVAVALRALSVTNPPIGRNKGWFYRKDESGKELLMAFVNAKGSCSVRPFDAKTGFALGKRYQSGNYQEQFADLLEGAVELTVDNQPSLERDCKQRLPDRTFAHLRSQVEKIA